ncbi:CheY chemotaxis protein or a CheY-like REC (receiver) domain [Devosia crocina]|uniref:CheY chemotaxis protein or a CheY-like REC (Receiver) domain n=1 Tax=Devosia crocina TaxID=429728 RepID=A0A1I7NRQ0_9HYPH|nr:response regulator [Devosia crocina]SFV37295.1 CheY chemotaxis protein or a CheY-like REC (receiver) domain [Devosia crocina]
MPAENQFQGRRVLVVEDDYLIVTELVESLHAMGAEVIGPVPDLPGAHRILERVSNIAGAILDVSVQGEPVFPLADELKRRGIPYIFSTGYDENAIPQAYRSRPRFTKPADDRLVSETILAEIEAASAA